jgi:hypothetical protein
LIKVWRVNGGKAKWALGEENGENLIGGEVKGIVHNIMS